MTLAAARSLSITTIDPVSLYVVLVAASLAVLTLIDVRGRRAPVEVPLLFGVIALGLLLLNAPETPVLFALGGMLFLAKPYLLVRLIEEFHRVPRAVHRVALAAMFVSWLAVLASLPSIEHPTLVLQLATLTVLLYVVALEAYAARTFVRGARATRGVTHWRLVLASAGSVLFAGAAVIAGTRIAVEGATPPSLPWALLLWPASTISSISYYLAFSPPAFLRRAWQLTELYRFLQKGSGGSVTERPDEILDALCPAAAQAVGGLLAFAPLHDGSRGQLVLPTTELRGLSDVLDTSEESAIGHAWRDRRALIARTAAEMGSGARVARFLGSTAFFCVPIATREHAFGLLLVFLRQAPLFPAEDLALLQLFAERSAIALANTRLFEEQRILAELLRESNRELERANEAKSKSLASLDEELRIARDIQLGLLPKVLPALPGWSVATYYQPARRVGGDFYDFLDLPDGRIGFIVGDVTDKGMPAALVMATTRSVIRATSREFDEPADLLGRVNEVLCADIPPKMFVTCLYLVLDPATGTVNYANAGHNPAYRNCAGAVTQLRATGLPLGLMSGIRYDEKQARLERGDTVLLYTDGLTEAHNAEREMFGFKRVATVFASDPGDGPMIELLLDHLRRFTGAGWEQEDDVTLITLRWDPSGARSAA